MASREDTSQPRMLAPTQIEAHVTRLTAVREGLRKFEANDGRAAECVRILEVTINVLNSEPFRTVPIEVAEVKDDETPETIEQVQKRERAATAEQVPDQSSDEPRRPTTGYGSEAGIV